MNTKSLIAAAFVASAPFAASASVLDVDANGLLNNGGSSTINQGDNELIFFNVDPTSLGFSHTFTLDAAGQGNAEVSLTTAVAGLFTGLVAQWLDASNGDILATGTPDAGGDIVISTVFADPDTLSQVLSITWKTAAPNAPIFDGNVTISTVPVPAGILLMGTALAGLGLARRKA
jgi:hypothetical protein